MPPTHRTASHTTAIIVGALAAFAVTPSRVNVIATPEVLPDESGFTCRPFGTQLADGGFNELCRFEPPVTLDAAPLDATTSAEPQGLTYYEDRLDGLWKCTDSGDLKPVCVLEKAKPSRPVKPAQPPKPPRPVKSQKALAILPEPPC